MIKDIRFSEEDQHARNTYYEECSICCESKARSRTGKDTSRPAEICYQCWYSHILSTVNRITYRAGDDLLSPFVNGNNSDIVSCLNSLQKAQADEIEEALFTKYTSFTQEIEKCPSQSCNFVYIGEKCKWNHADNVYNCPKCQMPLSANQTLTIKNVMASIYLLLANKCPKCSIPIEKISGCPHMTCPCGHHFCWYCYKDHPSGAAKRYYSVHNVRECVFIFLSKIVLFLICISSLLITFNGNSTIKWCLGLIGTIFSVLVRGIILDLIILLQLIIIMMNKRRPSSRQREKNKNAMAVGLVIFNILFLSLLYFIDELNFFLLVFFGEISILGICFGVGYAIIYSVETWFEFIA